MDDLIDVTGKGEHGYYVTDEPHPCSLPRCGAVSVAYYRSQVGGYGYSERCKARHWRRKFLCAPHLGQYLEARVVGDRIMRPMTEWEHERGEVVTP